MSSQYGTHMRAVVASRSFYNNERTQLVAMMAGTMQYSIAPSKHLTDT